MRDFVMCRDDSRVRGERGYQSYSAQNSCMFEISVQKNRSVIGHN